MNSASAHRRLSSAARLLAGLALLALPSIAAGQGTPSVPIEGTVVDSARGDPIAAALVRIVELHRGELTHDDGTFVLQGVPAGRYTLTVSRIGYRPMTRQVVVGPAGVAALRLVMAAAVVQLQRTVVTGSVTANSEEEVLSASSVLSDAALERRLGTTVGATLDGLAGVSVASIGPSTARPVIRGLGGDRILVLEDGQRPGDLSSTSGDHAVAVEALTARSLEVVRGPMSLLYGSSALGGVVNVVREEVPRSRPEHAHGSFSSQLESVHRGATAGGDVQLPLGRLFAMRAEATGRRLGETRTPAGSLVNTDARSFGGAVGLGYVADERHAGLAYRFYDNRYGIPGGFVGAHPDGVDVAMRRHAARGEVEWHEPGAGLSMLQLNSVVTRYTHREIEVDGEVGTRFGQTVWSGDVLARHDSVGRLTVGAFGVRAQFRDVETGGSLRTPSTRDWTLAGFAVEELGLGRLRLQLGARYDWSRYEPLEGGVVEVGDRRVPIRTRSFGAVSGSAGLLFVAAEGVRLGASASRAYRTPDFNELYSNGPHLAANSYDVGDPELRQETGIGLDAFLRITRRLVRGELAVFRNQLDDYIAPSSRGQAVASAQGQPLFQYTNEDARFSGAEAELELELSRRLVLEGSASLVRAEYVNARAPIPVFTPGERGIDTTFVPASRYPALVPPANGRVELRYERRRVFAGLGARFAARQDRTGDFEEPTDGYTVAHLTSGVRLLRGSQLHVLTLRVDNLLDTEYRQHLSRIKAIMPEPGRNVALLYRLTY